VTGAADDDQSPVSGKAVEPAGDIAERNVTGTGGVAGLPFVDLTYVEEHGAAAVEVTRLLGPDASRSAQQLA